MQRTFSCVFFTAILLFILNFNPNLYAQDLNVNVIIEDQQLSSEAREKLMDFKQQVQDYLNRNKFHDEEIKAVNATFQFNFTSASGDNYNCQIFVASQREIYSRDKNAPVKYTSAFKYLDDRVSFTYNRNMPIIRNDFRFDSFLSLLDYYAYMIMGYDEDSYYPQGGNKYFQKALDICNKPIADKRGWTETGGGSKPSRIQLVQELLNVRFDDFRKGYFEYHWMGLDSIAINPQNAYEYMLVALEKIGNIKKREVKAFNIEIFFDSKFKEIAEIFLNYGNRNVYDRLVRIDPSHQTEYEEKKKIAQ
jgi:hypothetical protein